MKTVQPSRLFRAALAAAIVLAATKADAVSWPQIALVRRLSGLANPVHVTNAGDRSGRLFVVEQRGRIRIVKNGALLPTPFLDITDRVSCCVERGLLSVAFPPGFTGAGVFFVDYTDINGDTAISRFFVSQTNPDVADAGSEQVMLHIAQPYANHNGGQLAFGPDGYLYIGMGDGGSGGDPQNNAQNPASLLGKILRIDVTSGAPTYIVPPSNPFVSRPGWRPEIWALGLRNPWRFSFDRKTGDLYIGDVGQNSREEVDFQPASSAGGENYGWRIMEGTACYNAPSCDPAGLVLPVTDYTHTAGDCSVTGGFVYRGLSYSALQGIYFYADFCTGRIRGLRRTATGWETQELLDAGFTISTFGEDEAGELYLVDYGGGVLYQVVAAAGSSSVLTAPVVVDAGGDGGARFTSELTLANRGTTPVSLDLTYTPAASLGASGGGTVQDTLDAGRQTTIPDAIAYLREKGLGIPAAGSQGGTLRIRVRGASGSDVVHASVRTTAPSGAGRAGLAYAAVGANETAEGPINLFGLREDAAFRSNLALLNAGDPADSSGIQLRVTLMSGDPGDARTVVLPLVSLGPGQWFQLNHVLSQAGMTNGWATVERVGGLDPFYA
ncbi:MAG: PQQ-dependent sugar dehydrogenase, partial [Acidithiobacillales bacterium]